MIPSKQYDPSWLLETKSTYKLSSISSIQNSAPSNILVLSVLSTLEKQILVLSLLTITEATEFSLISILI